MFDLTMERESSVIRPLKFQNFPEPFIDENVEAIGNTINEDQIHREESKKRINKLQRPELLDLQMKKSFDCKLNLKRANSDGKQNEKLCSCGKNTIVIVPQNIFFRNNRNNMEGKNKLTWNFSTYDYSLILTGKLKVEKKINKLKTTIINVCEWRALSKDIGQTNKDLPDPKEEAAKVLGLKKKSLDDYLMYLRLGIVLQYDFSNNLDIKFGNLRKYVKEYRLHQKWDKNRHQDVESLLPLTKSELNPIAKPDCVNN